ncbi:hypothetical protein [Shewanella benthica]|uniref:Uncharacterized protein n=1 Tax=Shewanella benthica KT99 TaxID=314608 RepID=A9DF78_9GAMM|nr:hypothetical protein [Shewanella benthica]EDP99988.1 hypothetical protein KT99_16886 [Shewanella benthica KT99]
MFKSLSSGIFVGLFAGLILGTIIQYGFAGSTNLVGDSAVVAMVDHR